MNPFIEQHLQIVKQLGGTIFFDTNGSNPELVKRLLDKRLIDVLAVSIKGLTPDECLATAAIKRKDFCWDNPLKTIEYGAYTKGVKVIVTHVCYNDASIEELRRFSDLLEPFPDVFYKINNLNGSVHKDESLVPVNSDKLIGLLKQLVEEKPFWKNRMIYINDKSGVTNYDRILFM